MSMCLIGTITVPIAISLKNNSEGYGRTYLNTSNDDKYFIFNI